MLSKRQMHDTIPIATAQLPDTSKTGCHALLLFDKYNDEKNGPKLAAALVDVDKTLHTEPNIAGEHHLEHEKHSNMIWIFEPLCYHITLHTCHT